MTKPRSTLSKKTRIHGWHRIGARISLGFLVVLVLHVCIAILGHIGLAKASRDAATQSRLQEDAILIVENDAAVVELQRDVLLFTYTDHPSIADRVRTTQADLLKGLKRASRKNLAPEEIEALKSMRAVLKDYGDHFETFLIDRGKRSQLRRDVLDPLGSELASTLRETLEKTQSREDYPATMKAGLALASGLALRDAANDYLRDPAAGPVRRFKTEQKRFDRALTELLSTSLPDADLRRIGNVRESLPAYESAFLQIVQATRSYLHLVNVVLAGNALEFQTLSTTFKQHGIAAIEDLSRKMAEDQQRFQSWSNIVSILTILLGMFFAWLIGQSVSKPILEMTGTLSSLAKGKAALIPGITRKDEIGEMARAAEVFKERNQETLDLLDHSRELTEMHARANQRLESVVEELSRSNDELDSFAYLASHDLKAPLRAISHLATWIEEDSAEHLPDESKDHLKTLRGRVFRLEALLDGLLQFSRAAREKYNVEEVDVQELIRNVVEFCDPPSGFTVSISGDDPTVQSYRPPLQQIILNLVGNAIKHHDRSTGVVDIQVRERPGELEIVVTDDGPGIPEQFHERVFKMFQTLKPRDEKEASGIGLSIVQKIVEAVRGEIRIESTGERGTRFALIWPLSDNQTQGSVAIATSQGG